ncbi:GH13198 [Drosophila grimshawi]|uniref:GH13198 n=2 Tax=Drosophila grimshawi TaxID=7222 RepID=B4JQF9_DROGR|nr:GH13198 [Drosophila grimshawi]
MDMPKMLLLLVVVVQPLSAEPAGYHYDRPGPSPPSSYTGHQFAPLSTVQPLPPVPALPSLPTGHGFQQRTPTQPAGSILSRFLPGTPAVTKIVSYPASAAPQTSVTYHGQQPTVVRTPSQLQQPINVPSAPGQPQLPFNVPSGPAAPQPLRIPFGKTALFSPGESYVDASGRQLKQYAVIEIIDNDISESPAPFLKSTFFDRYRAHLGASGIGATAFAGSGPASSAGSGRQLDSRANALVLEQQALSLQPRQLNQGQRQESVALGSGGLGYIRLPNGNVYLGSGSLGYISGQQRIASVREARTRSELTSDALHFGHGPLGGAGNFLRFK